MVKLRQSKPQTKIWSTQTLVLTMLFMITMVILTLSSLVTFYLHMGSNDSSPNDLTFSYRTMVVERDVDGLGERGKQWTQILSWQPRAFLYHNFLSKEECEYLIALAKPHMVKSTVVDSETGRSMDSRLRTSTGMFFSREQDKIIRNIEKRIADFSFIPVENGEGLQILHYAVGQKYEAHFDYFFDEFNIKHGGQRTATLLMYLSDVEEGGETVFPAANLNVSAVPWWNDLSECGKKGLSVKPKMGNALLFWSTMPDGTVDPSSLHGSCPVIEGNKWSATKWMHLEEFKSYA